MPQIAASASRGLWSVCGKRTTWHAAAFETQQNVYNIQHSVALGKED